MSDKVADLPDGPLHILVVGRKGQGKTELARMLWESWPADRLLVDVNGDVIDPDDAPDHDPVIALEPGFSSAWPEQHRTQGPDGRPRRMTLRYVPDHLVDADTYRDELDRAVGLAYSHPGTMLWIDEVGEVMPSNGRIGPHSRRALHMGRHQDLTLVMTGPRPKTIDPLVLAQADVIYIFDVPNPEDVRRIADECGWDRAELAEEVAGLGDHCYLRYLAKEHELSSWPPLPLPAKRRTRRLAADHYEQPKDLAG